MKEIKVWDWENLTQSQRDQIVAIESTRTIEDLEELSFPEGYMLTHGLLPKHKEFSSAEQQRSAIDTLQSHELYDFDADGMAAVEHVRKMGYTYEIIVEYGWWGWTHPEYQDD